MKSNKKRILYLIDILFKQSDYLHPLSLNQIVSLLQERGIEVNDRKTLYDDFKILDQFGLEVEYDKGYYLQDAPFSLAEIKVIVDALNSLKNLDSTFLKKLNDKLYGFISIYQSKQLRKLEYHNKHYDKKFMNRLEDTITALINHKSLLLKRADHQPELIVPEFLYRNNDIYYLYYHYLGKEKLYHLRFERIQSLRLMDQQDEIRIPKSKIIETIELSTNSFTLGDKQIVNIEIVDYNQELIERIKDDFSNAIFTNKNTFYLLASINHVFFAKLASYSDHLKILDREIADKYLDFLNKIVIRNSQENKNI